jgi:two-component system chemotaxis response regulator CheB
MTKARHRPIQVVVVDDSPVARELQVQLLQSANDIQVVGVGSNGEDAIKLARRLRPDVIALDVVMPKMDGLEATRRIMREVPTRIVIVTGNLMRSGEELTFQALRAGALTVIHKPGLADPETCDRLIHTIRLMADVPVVHHWGRAESGGEPRPAEIPSTEARRQVGVQMVGIASSTGGPAALSAILRQLPPDFPAPLLIVQHITQGFITGLAEWLDGETPLHVGLVGHGDRPLPGSAVLAPDDYHIRVNPHGIVELTKEPTYRGLRPSANYLFHSLAESYGPSAVGVVLTGMGDDGADGLAALRTAGGLTIAQDEKSSVVYGMPHEAVIRGAVSRVLPLEQIGVTLVRLARDQTREKTDG